MTFPRNNKIDINPSVITFLLKKALLFLKEIMNFFSFFCVTPNLKKVIIFYAEHDGYYPYFEGLIKHLIKKYDLSLCYVTSDADDPILKKRESKIKPFYLNKLLPLFMAFVNCKVFVMTLTDLNNFHLKRSFNTVHYIYMFHSLVSTHMMYRYGAFDHYDSIFCCGPHQINEIRRHEQLNSLTLKKLLEAGYYRLERIYSVYQRYLRDRPAYTGKQTILIAPSWGIGNILESVGEGLVDLLLSAGYRVIVRPHPETIRHSPKLSLRYKTRFRDNPDFIFESSIVTDDSLIYSDVLICDCSGVAIEYAFGTERPVLFLDLPLKIKNQRFRELGIEPLELSLRSEIGIIISLDKLNIIPEIISRLIAEREIYKNRIVELRKQYVYCFGNSSEVGAEYINNLIANKN